MRVRGFEGGERRREQGRFNNADVQHARQPPLRVCLCVCMCVYALHCAATDAFVSSYRVKCMMVHKKRKEYSQCILGIIFPSHKNPKRVRYQRIRWPFPYDVQRLRERGKRREGERKENRI